MSAPSSSASNLIAGKAELVADLETGNKPPEAWRIGTEHEKFVFDLETLRPLALGAVQLAWQAAAIDIDSPSDCLSKFKSNRYFGLILLAGMIAG